MLKKFTFIITACFNIVYASDFTPQVGDLLFQDLDCGTLCNGINNVTHGINNTYMSHVAIIYSIDNNLVMVAEANSKGVTLEPLSKFLKSSRDKNGRPMVIEERLKPQYQALIPGALAFIKDNLGKPYNATFIPNDNKSFYCSELIYKSFQAANNNKPVFKTHAMDFNNPKTGKIENSWQEYFNNLHTKAPEGMIGTNPGMMSRDDKLIIVHQYGQLRTHNPKV